MTRYLSLENLLELIDETGVGPIRDIGLLDSARAGPETTLWGDDAYLDLRLKAAVLFESLARNHALVDGNKRLAWVGVVGFLGLNGHELSASEDDAYSLVIAVSTGVGSHEDSAGRLRTWTARPA